MKKPRNSSKIIPQEEMTSFMKKVFAVVAKIPKGQVMTYAGVAKKIGAPGASRAVGTVLSKNFDPKIPCHRVIRSDGKIGQYNRGGPSAKRAILKKEGALK
jgi:methylated-DNA-[protein]-cysteine S-methyltransferase